MESGRYRPSGQPAGVPGAPDPAELEDFRDRLRLFAARRLGDWAAAEDVAQEALRRALEALRAGRIESSAALPGFLFQTSKNLCMHRGRSAGRERKALHRFASPSGEESDPAESPLGSLLSAERQSGVRQALGQLEPGERQLLEMTYRDELPSEEIGRQLGLTAGAVRVRRHRAIRRLAELLGVTKPADREPKE
jgi:RNA polymerase sigma-70 factor (ECF subfamily)